MNYRAAAFSLLLVLAGATGSSAGELGLFDVTSP